MYTGKIQSYKIYFHGEFVGIIDCAMTRDEAKIKFHNKYNEYNLDSLMALESN